jgi:1,4-alpha-glucan branching enzyme
MKRKPRKSRVEPAASPANGSQQVFGYTAPEAGSVLLVGDFTNWQEKPIALEKGPDGLWLTTVTLPPGEYAYRFLVDGEWRNDPACCVRVPNPYGSENCLRVAL